jgi:hypothetical protein
MRNRKLPCCWLPPHALLITCNVHNDSNTRIRATIVFKLQLHTSAYTRALPHPSPSLLLSRSNMPSDTFWSDACSYALSKPLPKLLEAAYASCIVTVRRAHAAVALAAAAAAAVVTRY